MDQKTDGHSEGGLNSGDDRRDDQLRTAAEVPPPAPADEVYHFSVVVARHVLLLEGKEIVTWADIEKKIASRPKPSQTHPDFYITRGAMEAGLYEPSKKEIWRLHGDYKLVGHSEGSLLPRADWHYDQIRTAADLKPDESLRIEGTVVTADGKPVAGAEVVLVSPVDASISYKPYDIYLVRGRLRNPLDEVMTHSDQEGRFAIYPPRDTPYAVLALHPVVGFGLTDRKQFTGEGKVRLLAWAGLESQFSQEPERQEASLRTRIAALGERPEIVLSQYWSDLKRPEPTLHFHFTQVPPIFETAISRDFPSPDGGLQGVSGASVSLLPGETRRVDLGPVTEQQRKFMEEMRHR